MANYHIVNLAGEERPIMFNLMAIASYCHVHKIKLKDLQEHLQDLDLYEVMKIIHYALAEGARLAQKSFPYKFDEEVATWLSEDQKGLSECMALYSTARFFPEDDNEEQVEKDDAGKKTKAPKARRSVSAK